MDSNGNNLSSTMGGTKNRTDGKVRNLGILMAVYLFGIFMGAIDTGIVTPARTVIQNNLAADEKAGIWMITIYTLFYAASIPVMGKLADKYGRKIVYIISISLFGLGSLFCGLAQDFGSFTLLLAARSVQAVGGGGIMPVATAEFGTIFPPEKRGMALGLIGGVYGIANIFGSTAGSAILDLFGKDNWQYIFYINLPISLFVIIAGLIFLPNNKSANVKKIDIQGILLIVVMVLSLMYGLRNIDFFNFRESFLSLEVYPFLAGFLCLLPIFILVEKSAQDPVMNLGYFTNFKIVITLVISFIVGVIMMGMVFVPQFSENVMKIASGSGGYFVMILGLFAGAGAPVSGKLIDRYGAKFTLMLGLAISIVGALFLILITIPQPGLMTVSVSLLLIGLGMGFTIGAPLNYMMLEHTSKEESNSALATLSLVRSLGTAIAPAIMVGFLAHAGSGMEGQIRSLLPKEANVPVLPYAQELTDTLNRLKSGPNMKDRMNHIAIPDLTSMTKVNLDMQGDGSFKMPADLLDQLKTADVTNIVARTKLLAERMFADKTPAVIADIQARVQKGIDELQGGMDDLEKTLADMKSMEELKGKQGTMKMAIAKVTEAKAGMEDTLSKMKALKEAVPGVFEKAKDDYLGEIDRRAGRIEGMFQETLNGGFKQVYLTTVIAAIIAMLILLFYRRKPLTHVEVDADWAEPGEGSPA